jgi:hypothetical protein
MKNKGRTRLPALIEYLHTERMSVSIRRSKGDVY